MKNTWNEHLEETHTKNAPCQPTVDSQPRQGPDRETMPLYYHHILYCNMGGRCSRLAFTNTA